MVLHRKCRLVLDDEALDGAVVEVDVRDFRAVAEGIWIDGEAVVLRGDLYLAGGEVLHWLIAAVMAELELVGAAAEGEAQDLVAEADAEDRHVAEECSDVFARAH